MKRFLPLITAFVFACSPAENSTPAQAPTGAIPPVETSTTIATSTTAASVERVATIPVVLGVRTLALVDDGSKDPTFAAFRIKLLDVIRRKDRDELLALVDPAIRFTFGKGAGLDAFARSWKLDEADSPLWRELGEILSLGGKFQENGDFFAPYTYSSWPDEIDAFEHIATVCSETLLYEEADTSSPALAILDHQIMKIGPADPVRLGKRDSRWRQVTLPDASTGFVEDRCARMNLDYRAAFSKKSGAWRMVFLVAGD